MRSRAAHKLKRPIIVNAGTVASRRVRADASSFKVNHAASAIVNAAAVLRTRIAGYVSAPIIVFATKIKGCIKNVNAAAVFGLIVINIQIMFIGKRKDIFPKEYL